MDVLPLFAAHAGARASMRFAHSRLCHNDPHKHALSDRLVTLPFAAVVSSLVSMRNLRHDRLSHCRGRSHIARRTLLGVLDDGFRLSFERDAVCG